MSKLIEWSLEAIRAEGAEFSWMEVRRVEWASLLASRLKFLLDGAAFLLICDDERAWFENYFLHNINRKNNARPVFPFFSLKALYPQINEMNSAEERLLLEDMLNIVFPNGFIYFYVGKPNSKFAQCARSKEDSYMWLFDEQAQNSFFLNSNDKLLDSKLISLFKLFDKSIDAVLFGKATL